MFWGQTCALFCLENFDLFWNGRLPYIAMEAPPIPNYLTPMQLSFVMSILWSYPAPPRTPKLIPSQITIRPIIPSTLPARLHAATMSSCRFCTWRRAAPSSKHLSYLYLHLLHIKQRHLHCTAPLYRIFSETPWCDDIMASMPLKTVTRADGCVVMSSGFFERRYSSLTRLLDKSLVAFIFPYII